MKNINETNDQVLSLQANVNDIRNAEATSLTSKAPAKQLISDASIIKIWSTHRQVFAKPYLNIY